MTARRADTQKSPRHEASQQPVNNFDLSEGDPTRRSRVATPYASRRTRKPKPANGNWYDGVRTHSEVLEANLGAELTSGALLERAVADRDLERQTQVIAAKLKASGRQTLRSDGDDLVMIGMQSGAMHRSTRWRNVNILPVKAQENRRHVLGEFCYWRERNRRASEYARYLVVSSGATCTLDELPARWEWFSKRVGSFKKLARRDHELEIVLAAFECTFNRGDDGLIRANLHVNIVYIPDRAFKLHDEETGEVVDGWVPLLGWIRSYFKVDQIEDAGKLEDPREVIKYVTKPADMIELSAGEMGQVAELLVDRRCRLVRTYGEFADWRASIKEAGQKVVYDHSFGSYVLSQRRSKREAIAADAEKELRERTKGSTPAQEKVENQILFRTLPQARNGLLKESFVGVRGYTQEPETDRGRANLEILQRIHVEELAALEAKGVTPSSRLDICTLTRTSVAEVANMPADRRRKLLARLNLDPDMLPIEIERSAAVFDAVAKVLERKLSVPTHDFSAVDYRTVADAAAARSMTAEELEAAIPY